MSINNKKTKPLNV